MLPVWLTTPQQLTLQNFNVIIVSSNALRSSANSVLFNLFVIVEPLIYFRVCHGTPINKN